MSEVMVYGVYGEYAAVLPRDIQRLQDHSKELERHLKILISLTSDLQDQLTNACEDFEGEQYIGEERDEDTAFVDAARDYLARSQEQ